MQAYLSRLGFIDIRVESALPQFFVIPKLVEDLLNEFFFLVIKRGLVEHLFVSVLKFLVVQIYVRILNIFLL